MNQTAYNVTLPDTTLLNCGYTVSILSYDTERTLEIYDKLCDIDDERTTYYALPIFQKGANEYRYWQNVCIERSLRASKVLVVDRPPEDLATCFQEAMADVIEKAMKMGLAVIFAHLTEAVTDEQSYTMTSAPAPLDPETSKEEEA